jgi:TatD DNase family protein
MLIDTHCHLDFPELAADIGGVMARARANGVGRMVTISTRVRKFPVYAALAERHDNLFCTVGTHPHNAAEEPDIATAEIVALSAHPKCIAIGEAGLDYHYDKSPRDLQAASFHVQIAAARESGLPLVIHARAADADMIEILESEHARGAFDAILHCFSSGPELARRGLALGFYLSFSGILTFKASDELRAIAATTPMDRLLVETDAPYLAPVPHRGKKNEPAFVRHTAETLASVKGVSLDEMARMTTSNALRLFRKMPPLPALAAA